LATPDLAAFELRLAALEQAAKIQDESIDDMGGTVDHLVNTLDSMVLPTQKAHAEAIARHELVVIEAHDYISRQTGVGQFVQRCCIYVGAVASIAAVIKLFWPK
jgi:hypothetical protein